MKNGCFLKILIGVTILIAAISYFVTNKSDINLPSFLRDIAINGSFTEIVEKLKSVPETEQKKQLNASLQEYLTYLRNSKVIKQKTMKSVADSIGMILQDGQITNIEIANFQKFLEKVKHDEK